MVNKICLVQGDDWMGVYLNDDLVYEGHSIDDVHLLEIAEDFQPFETDVKEADLEWLAEVGSLPPRLKDIIEAK